MRSIAIPIVLGSVALLAPPPTAAAQQEVAVLETNFGTLVFRFYQQQAPATSAQIKRLVRAGFYDGRRFYRVVAGHVIQGGDGGKNEQPTVKLEAGAHPHVLGSVGLARDQDPDSGSTELYICLAPRPHLDGGYAVFGQLIAGLEVLERIAEVEVVEQWIGEVAFHRPRRPVVIERAYLETREVAE